MALIDDSVRDQINAIVENEVLPGSDEDESDDVGDGKADSKNEYVEDRRAVSQTHPCPNDPLDERSPRS